MVQFLIMTSSVGSVMQKELAGHCDCIFVFEKGSRLEKGTE